MNEYIEDLHAKEDALEDNAFELIQLTIKLEESEENLKEANASKDKFFSIVAHDLKSPFVGLLGITEMLDTDYDEFDEKEKRELIRSLYDISKSTFELLEGLLEWARAKQGQMTFNPSAFNLFHVAASLSQLLRANTFKKEIMLHNLVDVNAMVYADRNMASTVLRNLLANAIKFTPQNGTIDINAQIENNLMKISVKDSGIGMTPENIKKLFRIDVNHTTLGTNSEKGTGLGLILCKELVEKHGTNIWAESKLGEGSVFVFTLPLKENLE
ncbi:MAG: HAMP domain-containing sensor histidine kinase [Melioribacteraceae bacterium]|jgi:signal transduction histidine kinase|nr:HAMP domain-containing sensor histidine kinase [Melioribacteraceae bacterium]